MADWATYGFGEPRDTRSIGSLHSLMLRAGALVDDLAHPGLE